MTYKLPRALNGGRAPGTWKPASGGGKANITCPECHGSMSLNHHAVSNEGLVSPSLVCPNHHCTFAEWVHLDAWQTPH